MWHIFDTPLWLETDNVAHVRHTVVVRDTDCVAHARVRREQPTVALSEAAGPVRSSAKYDTESLSDSALDLQERTLQYGADGLPYTMLSQVTRRSVGYRTKAMTSYAHRLGCQTKCCIIMTLMV